MSVETHQTIDPSTKLGLPGKLGAWSQFGAVGIIGFLLVTVMTFVGIATYNLVGQQLQRAHEDRVAERAIERDERRFEREQSATFTRDLLGRVSTTLERIDRSQSEHAATLDRIARSQAEQATRLADLARIVERLQNKRDDPPQNSDLGASEQARVRPIRSIMSIPFLTRFALISSITTFTPPNAPPSKNDVVLPSSPAKVVEPPPPPNDPGTLTITVGRFAWAYVKREIPVTYFVDGEAVAKLDLAGIPFAGINYDEPIGTRPKAYPFPADAKGKACVLLGSAVGTARVQVWGNPGEGKDPELLASIVVRVVAESKPVPVGPDVKPPPPAVVDSKLVAKLRPIYAASTDPEKKWLAGMAAVGMDWAAAAVDDPRYSDAGALESAVAATQKSLILNPARLKPFGPVIGEALLAALPNDSPQTKLTPEIRKALKAVYLDAAAAYRQLAGE